MSAFPFQTPLSLHCQKIMPLDHAFISEKDFASEAVVFFVILLRRCPYNSVLRRPALHRTTPLRYTEIVGDTSGAHRRCSPISIQFFIYVQLPRDAFQRRNNESHVLFPNTYRAARSLLPFLAAAFIVAREHQSPKHEASNFSRFSSSGVLLY